MDLLESPSSSLSSSLHSNPSRSGSRHGIRTAQEVNCSSFPSSQAKDLEYAPIAATGERSALHNSQPYVPISHTIPHLAIPPYSITTQYLCLFKNTATDGPTRSDCSGIEASACRGKSFTLVLERKKAIWTISLLVLVLRQLHLLHACIYLPNMMLKHCTSATINNALPLSSLHLGQIMDADLRPQLTSDTTTLLDRLASKPGVQSTLILSRKDGTIIRSTGLLSSSVTESPNNTSNDVDASAVNGVEGTSSTSSAQELARLVFSFVSNAGSLALNLSLHGQSRAAFNGEIAGRPTTASTESESLRENNGNDEVKLLRLRTRKNELVIVPDKGFLLVVVHATPATI